MKNRNLVISAALLLALLCLAVFLGRCSKTPQEQNITPNSQKEAVERDSVVTKTDTTEVNEQKDSEETNIPDKEEPIKAEVQKTSILRQGDVMESPVYSSVPLSAVSEINSLPANVQAQIKNIARNSNIFMLNKNSDRVLMVTENPSNIRHGIDFIEISVPTGHQTCTTLGYNGKIQDSENEVWDFDEKSRFHTPTKHVKFNKDGDVEFIEYWYYSNDNPVKYEMKDANGNVISVRKETLDNAGNLRVENLLYNKDGNTKIGVITSYSGANVERFTYYNADKINDSTSVFDEYTDGLKTRETVYSSDMKVKNSYEASYEDGERDSITVFDGKKQKIQEIKDSD